MINQEEMLFVQKSTSSSYNEILSELRAAFPEIKYKVVIKKASKMWKFRKEWVKNLEPTNPVTCLGCIEDQPNQLAHMDYGGCLYSDSFYELPPLPPSPPDSME